MISAKDDFGRHRKGEEAVWQQPNNLKRSLLSLSFLCGPAIDHIRERSGDGNRLSEKRDEKTGVKSNIPLELERDDIHDVDVERDQETGGAFKPTRRVSIEVKKKYLWWAYQRAVAAKHIVLPTYMGSRRTLKGNLGTISVFLAQVTEKNIPFDAMIHQNAKVVS
jgi:hypothetical protein